MKRLCLLALCLFSLLANAQNVILNPSFETTSGPTATCSPQHYVYNNQAVFWNGYEVSTNSPCSSGGVICDDLGTPGFGTFPVGLSPKTGHRALQISEEWSISNPYQSHAVGSFSYLGGRTLPAGCFQLCVSLAGSIINVCGTPPNDIQMELVESGNPVHRQLIGTFTVPLNDTWGFYGALTTIASGDANTFDQIDISMVNPGGGPGGIACTSAFVDDISLSPCGTVGCEANPPCNAAFQVSIQRNSASNAAITMLTSTTVTSETYTITDNAGTNLYTGNGTVSVVVPFGTYTVCHSVTDMWGRMCQSCKTVCFDQGDVTPGAQCDPSFNLSITSNNYGGADITFSNASGSTLGSESYTINDLTPGPLYSGPATTWSGAYGIYTVCHTIHTAAGSTCTSCFNVCIGDAESFGQKSLSVGKSNTALISSVNVYPNPATDYASVRFTLNSDAKVTIQVVDITGRVIYSGTKQQLGAGTQVIKLPTTTLSTGSYLVKVIANDCVFAQRLSVLR